MALALQSCISIGRASVRCLSSDLVGEQEQSRWSAASLQAIEK